MDFVPCYAFSGSECIDSIYRGSQHAGGSRLSDVLFWCFRFLCFLTRCCPVDLISPRSKSIAEANQARWSHAILVQSSSLMTTAELLFFLFNSLNFFTRVAAGYLLPPLASITSAILRHFSDSNLSSTSFFAWRSLAS